MSAGIEDLSTDVCPRIVVVSMRHSHARVISPEALSRPYFSAQPDAACAVGDAAHDRVSRFRITSEPG